MKTKQHHFLNNAWKDFPSALDTEQCQLVLVFGAPESITKPEVYGHLKQSYPKANIVFASTAGEILGDAVYDNSAVVTAIQLEKTTVKCVKTNISQHKNSFETGNYLMKQLAGDDLNCIFLISDGTFINGSELVDGFNSDNPHNIPVTGGLAGDAARFEKTYTGLNEVPSQGNIIAIGFYGKNLAVGHGSFGGWDEFGHERTITKSDKNVLFEIDGKNALHLYKEYLGDYVNELPGSALLFPLSIRVNRSDKNLVRTILSIDEDKKSMTFAGNLPEGSKVRLMKANFDKLIEASSTAAENSFTSIKNHQPDLAILISCVGRKLILQERTDEELEAAKEVLGANTAMTGFYSYGEISPFNASTQCELHNQTMTITTFTEI
jgi:hypothetical protein